METPQLVYPKALPPSGIFFKKMPPCTILERARESWDRSAIQYESYGSCFFESIERHKSSGYDPALESVDCLGNPCRRPAARLDAPALLRDKWGHAGLRRHCEELAPPRALCADRWFGADISHVDPAARLSSLPCPVFSALWDRKLRRRGVDADRNGTDGLPLPRGFRAPDCSTGTQDWRHDTQDCGSLRFAPLPQCMRSTH